MTGTLWYHAVSETLVHLYDKECILKPHAYKKLGYRVNGSGRRISCYDKYISACYWSPVKSRLFRPANILPHLSTPAENGILEIVTIGVTLRLRRWKCYQCVRQI